MKFTKMQGAGNDFVVIDTGDEQKDWSQLAVAICDRHLGVGADGVLLFMPSQTADFRMRIFNADGSEANTCGNGIRCLVKHHLDRKKTKSATGNVTVETCLGVREAWYHRRGAKACRVKVGMGMPKSAGGIVPVKANRGQDEMVDIKMEYEFAVDSGKLHLNLVSIGNLHAVYFGRGALSDFPLGEIGPKLDRQPAFPDGINFEVVRLLSDGRIEARVWEHGVGETLACGSGACAIAVAARLHGYTGNKVEVDLPGGMLEVEWDGAGEVFLSGPAETVFAGEWADTGPVRDETPPDGYIKNEVMA